jgi:hypothetical protein
MGHTNNLNDEAIKHEISTLQDAFGDQAPEWIADKLGVLEIRSMAYDMKKRIALCVRQTRERKVMSAWQLFKETGLQGGQLKGIEECTSNYGIDSLLTILAALNLEIAVVDDNTSATESPQ